MCLGGHLAYRCALNNRVKAAVCYFATDIHSATLGEGKRDDSLERAGDIKGELIMVCFNSTRPFTQKKTSQKKATDGRETDFWEKRQSCPAGRTGFDPEDTSWEKCHVQFLWNCMGPAYFFFPRPLLIFRSLGPFSWWRILTDAFIRDELSKGRYDPAISKSCFEMLLELFNRTLKVDLGDHDGKKIEIEDVCWVWFLGLCLLE